MLYGEVFHNDLENIMAMEELVEDANRMDADLKKQKKEFESKNKQQGKDYNRL